MSKPQASKGAKKVVAIVKLQVPAGSATPSPPVGPALGQRGVSSMEFCKAFNAATQAIEKGTPLPVKITIYSDKTFTFEINQPPATYLLIKEAQIKDKKGSSTPNTRKVGRLTREQIEAVAKVKMQDLTAASLEAAMRTLAGSARSMGIDVEEI